MVFSSITFLFYFLPCFLLLYYLLPWKNAVLLVGSLAFYAWGEPRFVPLLMASALINFGFGRAIAAARVGRRPLLAAGIGANLCMLMYFKYLGFFTELFNRAAQPFGQHLDPVKVVLPLGISFFTFQGISYLVDIYRKDIQAQSSFWRFAMYKAMFPQLIAGPIVRYRQIAADIGRRSISNARVWTGVQLFVLGLSQKILIANPAAVPADYIFALAPAQLTAASAWLGAAAYSVQILFDFSGYSTMAIGLAHLLGFSYPPNFNRPYTARSLTDFWRRWHISLSSWFRDYVYIPLGGNRRGPLRTWLNLALVFFLCGLWHGAAWTFVIWGLWHGALLVTERLGLERGLARLPRPAAQAYTLLLVVLGWVWFRASDVPHAIAYLAAMFGQGTAENLALPWQMFLSHSGTLAVVLGLALAALPLDRVAAALLQLRYAGQATRGALVAAGMALCIIGLAAGSYNPFIYFRF